MEFGFSVVVEYFWLGLVCNLWNIDYIVGVFLLGLGVLVVVGVVLIVYVNDGGGLICILVVCNGLVGFKLLCGWLLLELEYCRLLVGIVVNGVLICMVCDIVVFYCEVECFWCNY